MVNKIKLERRQAMDYAKILGLIVALSGKVQQDLQDRKITVKELLELISAGVEDLGVGGWVILDLTKKSDANK